MPLLNTTPYIRNNLVGLQHIESRASALRKISSGRNSDWKWANRNFLLLDLLNSSWYNQNSDWAESSDSYTFNQTFFSLYSTNWKARNFGNQKNRNSNPIKIRILFDYYLSEGRENPLRVSCEYFESFCILQAIQNRSHIEKNSFRLY